MHINPPGELILRWNNIYLEAVRRFGGAPGPIARIGAMLHLAMHDAVVHAGGGSSATYLPKPSGNFPGATPEASAAFAARKVLSEAVKGYLETEAVNLGGVSNPLQPHLPDLSFNVDAFLAGTHEMTQTVLRREAEAAGDSRAKATATEAADASQALGEAVAQNLLADRANDGSGQGGQTLGPPFGYAAGDWRPTGSGPALTALWGKVKSFSRWEQRGKETKDFRPTFPYQSLEELLASDEYVAQVEDVRRLGSAHSTERSREQTEIAFFWANDLNGTSKPPGQLFTISQIVARQQNTVASLLDTARLFALVAAAMADAAVIAWHVKYLFPITTEPANDDASKKKLIRLWRPESAIRLAELDGNPKTIADPSWEPLSAMADGLRFSPPFPAYISGHATFGAAHAAAMRRFYGRDGLVFTATTEDPHALRDESGVRRTRTLSSFTAAALENGRSRIYLGVHYQFDAEGGYECGTAVGDYAFENVFKPLP